MRRFTYSTISWIVVPGVKTRSTPFFTSFGMSASGMSPPPKSTTSPILFSRSSSMNTRNREMCAPAAGRGSSPAHRDRRVPPFRPGCGSCGPPSSGSTPPRPFPLPSPSLLLLLLVLVLSEHRRVGVYAHRLPEGIAHLAEGDVRARRVHQERHQVHLRVEGPFLQRGQARLRLFRIPLPRYFLRPRDLLFLHAFVDLQQGDRGLVRGPVDVEADDALLPRVHQALEVERRVGHLPLGGPPPDRGHHPPHP